MVRPCPDREGAQGPDVNSGAALGPAPRSQGQRGPHVTPPFSSSVACPIIDSGRLSGWSLSLRPVLLGELLRFVPAHTGAAA